MSVRALGITAASFALGACSACSEEPAPPPPPAALATPEPWTLGAAGDQELALPPPCELAGDALRTVLPRRTRIAADPVTLGQVGAAEIAELSGERIDAAGVVRMALGRTEVSPLSWPPEGEPHLAYHEGGGWLSAMRRDRRLQLWRAGRSEHLGAALDPVDLRCEKDLCALLAGDGDGAELFVGRATDPSPSWDQRALEEGEAVSIASLADREDGWVARVALLRAHRLRWITVDADRARAPALDKDLAAPYGAFDAIAAPELWAALPASAGGCHADGGGLVLARGGGEPRRLRSALPASRAELRPLTGGLLVTWLAPLDCRSGQKILYASVLDGDGRPVGPVTALGEASDYAVAARGERAEVWMLRDRTLSWAPMRCALGG